MPLVRANDLIRSALLIIGEYSPGEQLEAADGVIGLERLNGLLGLWRTMSVMAIVKVRERFDLEADRGGGDDPYTIGPGGDFDTEKPAKQTAIVAASLILTSPGAPNEVRVPLGLETDQSYFAKGIPDMRSGQPTSLYYSPTYAGGLGTVYLWPVPDVDTNDLELLIERPLSAFPDGTTQVDVPDGWDHALTFNLARVLQSSYGQQMSADDKLTASNALRILQAANSTPIDIANDAAILSRGGRPVGYNIDTGTGG